MFISWAMWRPRGPDEPEMTPELARLWFYAAVKTQKEAVGPPYCKVVIPMDGHLPPYSQKGKGKGEDNSNTTGNSSTGGNSNTGNASATGNSSTTGNSNWTG